MSNKIYNWRQLDLQSMDDILCAGNSNMSKAIQWFQRYTGAPEESAMLSHVAGVLRPKLSQGCCWYDMEFSNSGLYVEESTTMNKWAGKSGVQINPFDRWLDNYDGKVWVVKNDIKRTGDMLADDDYFWHQHCNDEYESGIPGFLELLRCGLMLSRHVRKIKPDYKPKFTDNPHCTEHHCKRLQSSKMMSDMAIPSQLPPWVWWELIAEHKLVTSSEPIRIK